MKNDAGKIPEFKAGRRSKWPNKVEPLPGATRRAASANPPAHAQPTDSESQEHAQPSAETESAPTHAASVPFMITHQMEASLRECGFPQERINTMTPSEAWEILQAEAGRIAGELSKLHRARAVKSEQDAEFYAGLIKTFGATFHRADAAGTDEAMPGPLRSHLLSSVGRQDGKVHSRALLRFRNYQLGDLARRAAPAS